MKVFSFFFHVFFFQLDPSSSGSLFLLGSRPFQSWPYLPFLIWRPSFVQGLPPPLFCLECFLKGFSLFFHVLALHLKGICHFTLFFYTLPFSLLVLCLSIFSSSFILLMLASSQYSFPPCFFSSFFFFWLLFFCLPLPLHLVLLQIEMKTSCRVTQQHLPISAALYGTQLRTRHPSDHLWISATEGNIFDISQGGQSFTTP